MSVLVWCAHLREVRKYGNAFQATKDCGLLVQCVLGSALRSDHDGEIVWVMVDNLASSTMCLFSLKSSLGHFLTLACFKQEMIY